MSDEWASYFLRVDGDPASIFFDLGIAKVAPVRASPQQAYIRIFMVRPREDGLSSSEEYETLLAMEDALTARAKKISDTIYVGRNTSSGNRDLYFYTADGPAFEYVMKEAMRDFPGYNFQTGFRPDPEWKIYLDFLYPTPLQHQQIVNRSVIENLAHHGDHTDQPRRIDHFAYFPDQKSCEAFEAFVRAEGFSIIQLSSRREDGSYGLNFSKTGIPDNIDSITLPLFQDALDHGGGYDGWGCEVVS